MREVLDSTTSLFINSDWPLSIEDESSITFQQPPGLPLLPKLTFIAETNDEGPFKGKIYFVTNGVKR